MSSSFTQAGSISNAALAQLLLNHQQQQRLTRQLKARLPADLALSLQHVNIAKGCLFLYCNSASWAWQLRFEQAHIRALAKQLQWPSFRDIKLRLMTPDSEPGPLRSVKVPAQPIIDIIHDAGKAQPDAALGQALTRLSTTLARLHKQKAG
ncbi:MAG: DciA family protein [Methylococcales bacterium]|nr:DciA family protein [Methylococcales bacterium]